MFSCISCQVQFGSPEDQRLHMKSDWHRYNLKRKVVELPPLSLALFKQKITEMNPINPPQPANYACQCCRKSFSSEGSYNTHMNSKKHKDALKQSERTSSDSEAKDLSSSGSYEVVNRPSKNWRVRISQAQTDEEINQILTEKMENSKRLGRADCLFCPLSSKSFEENLEHMRVSHSFYVPDVEHLTDLEGLIQYLGDKISVTNTCIFCNGKGKQLFSTEAVQQHMVSKSHCKIPFEDEDLKEIAEFYDYLVQEVEDKDWESVSGDENDDEMAIDDEEDIAVVSLNQPSNIYIDDEDESLVLSNGARIGHRQFRRYWSQNIRPTSLPLPGSRLHPEMISRLSNNYSSMVGYNPSQFQLLIKGQIINKERQKQNKELGNKKKEFRLKVGIRQNNQRHYRDQTGMIC